MVVELKKPGKEEEGQMKMSGGMKCPVCDVSLSMSDRQGIGLDLCPDCRGV